MEEGVGPGLKWCVDCGGEHTAWAVRCAFCGGALGSTEPVPEEVSAGGHEMGGIDISDLDPDELAYVELVLGSAGVPHQVEGTVLQFPEVDRSVVEEVLEDLAVGPGVDSELVVPDAAAAEVPTPAAFVASTTRRVLARVVGGAVWLLGLIVLLAVLAVTGVLDGVRYAPVTEILLVVEVVLVAVFGWDLGKLALGLRVVGDSERPPGWAASAVRAAVLWGPYVALGWAAWFVSDVSRAAAVGLAWAGPVWLVAVGWSIASGPDRRGWHDRIAGTRVLDFRPETLAERTRRIARSTRPDRSTGGSGPSRGGISGSSAPSSS